MLRKFYTADSALLREVKNSADIVSDFSHSEDCRVYVPWKFQGTLLAVSSDRFMFTAKK